MALVGIILEPPRCASRFRLAVLMLAVIMAPSALSGQAVLQNANQARSILREGLEASDPLVRVEAITATSMIGYHELVLARLEHCLKEKDVRVRLAAVHAFVDLASPQGIEPLRSVLQNDKVPEVAFAAAQALQKLNDPAGAKALMEVYEGKRKSTSGMIEQKERETTNQFHSFYSSLMFITSKGIGYVPVPGVGEGFTALEALTHDKGVSDRARVVLILGGSNSTETLDWLRGALQDKDWSVRAAAAQMIAHGAHVELRDNLVPLFSDKNRKVRFRAAGAFLHVALIQYPQK
jgi:HEAT repeat protein